MLRGLLIRIIVVGAVPVAFFSPFAGVLFYLWYSHGRPNDFIYPQYAFDNGAFLIAVASLVGYCLFELHRSPPRWQGMVTVVLFWFWIALSTLFATDRSIALPKLSQYTNIIVIAFLVATLANSESRIRSLLNVVAVSVGLLGAKAAFDFIVTGGQFRAQGVGGLMKEQNEFALALNMAIPMLIGLSYLQENRWIRYGFRAIAAGCFISVIATYSRSGLLGLALAVFLVIWYSKRRVLGFATLAVAFVFLLPFVPQKAMDRYKTIPTAAEVDPSAIGRLEAWQTGIKMMKAHPVFGVGPLNFLTEFHNYSPEYHARVAHNAFVALGAESGIPAVVLFITLIGLAIFEMWRLRRLLRHYPGMEELAAYCLILQMTLMVYIVPNCFINRQNQDMMYHLIGMSAGLAALVKRRVYEFEPQPEESATVGMVAEPASA